MEQSQFSFISRSRQKFNNPLSEAKLAHTLSLLQLNPGERVLEISSGHGELARRVVPLCWVNAMGLPLCGRLWLVKMIGSGSNGITNG